MANFFSENEDIIFQFERLDLSEIIKIKENDFSEHQDYPYAPESVEDAIDSYRKVLNIVGKLSADYIAPRAPDNDIEGSKYADGKVTYARGIRNH